MNKKGHTRIWNVGYSTTRPAIEVLSLADLRARALRAREEFLRPQRVHFELLIAVTGGTLHHTVDFVGHHLHPGDVLWIRAGQVQEWEWFDDDVMTQPAEVAATIVLFEPTRVDEQARALCDPDRSGRQQQPFNHRRGVTWTTWSRLPTEPCPGGCTKSSWGEC
ncbi:hypothetical protein FXW78_27900 [Rhodococcus opacus]|nr:hypothetical protein [Rhodococcus opacus]